MPTFGPPLITFQLWARLRSPEATSARAEEPSRRAAILERARTIVGRSDQIAHETLLGGRPACVEDFEARFLDLATLLHPDYGGDAQAWEQLSEARSFFDSLFYGPAGRPCTGPDAEVSWKI